MTRHTQRLYHLKRGALGAALVLLAAGFYLLSAQLITWRPASASLSTARPAKPVPCAAADANYCSLVRRLVPAVEAGDFSQLIADQGATSVTCPVPGAGAYCTAVQAGTPIALFTVYQGDQPRRMMRNDYIAFFRSYEARAGRFIYTAQPSGTQNPLLFRGLHNTVSLELQLRQLPGGSWQLAWPIAVQ